MYELGLDGLGQREALWFVSFSWSKLRRVDARVVLFRAVVCGRWHLVATVVVYFVRALDSCVESDALEPASLCCCSLSACSFASPAHGS